MQIKKERVTIRFVSDNKNDYLYDDKTGFILPWNEDKEKALVFLFHNYNNDKNYFLDKSKIKFESLAFVRHYLETYDAFFRETTLPSFQNPSKCLIEDFIRNNSRALYLFVSEDCNLRCKYCVFSDAYPLYPNHKKRKMSLNTALRAVDWFVELIDPQIFKKPYRKIGLNFFGGEPLLNMNVITRVLEHTSNKYPNLFNYFLTTNGTLLTEKNIEIFTKYNVHIALSLDGPLFEHDRNRMFIDGKGSYEVIIKNLKIIREKYYDFWRQNIFCVSVYDWKTDIYKCSKFFESDCIVPNPILVNMVLKKETDYYESFSVMDKNLFLKRLQRARILYKKAKIKNRLVSPYLELLIGSKILNVFLRRRINDSRPNFLPYSGTCIPGEKIAVGTDGKINICERLSGRQPIGDIYKGLNYRKIIDLIEDYYNRILVYCVNCPVTKLCSYCFAHFESFDGFRYDKNNCFEFIEYCKEALKDYISILEENPLADFTLLRLFKLAGPQYYELL